MVSEAMRERALACVKPKRRPHVEGVAKTARKLAGRWGVDPDTAEIAALLHDCTKRFDDEEQLKLCEKYGIILSQADLESLPVLHALTGAEYARQEFGVSDEICDAIRTHTTGAAGMTLLQQIIYLADLIEPTRDFSGVKEIRKLAGCDLQKALISATAQTIAYVLERRQSLHPATVETYNSLLRAGQVLTKKEQDEQ